MGKNRLMAKLWHEKCGSEAGMRTMAGKTGGKRRANKDENRGGGRRGRVRRRKKKGRVRRMCE